MIRVCTTDWSVSAAPFDDDVRPSHRNHDGQGSKQRKGLNSQARPTLNTWLLCHRDTTECPRDLVRKGRITAGLEECLGQPRVRPQKSRYGA